MMRCIITIAFLFTASHFYGQNSMPSEGKVLAIDSIVKATITNGDTLSITVRNLTINERGFTVEALSLEKEPYYYNAVYSAYFNNDTSFFKKLKAAQKRAKQTHTQYVLPGYVTTPYNIKSGSDTTINFIMKGITIQKETLIRLRITSDIVDDDYETVYSNPIRMTSLPN